MFLTSLVVVVVGGTNELWEVKVISFDPGGFNETISCHNKKTGRSFKMGLQTPIATWFIDDVTMIPGSKVIFRLDNQQIVVADPERNRIAVLALGRNPVVEMPVKGPKGESEIMK